MKEYNVTVGENGRMIIPALFRKTLGLKQGDEVKVILSDDNSIIIHTPRQSLKKLQNLIKEKSKSKSYVKDLFTMRRSEEI